MGFTSPLFEQNKTIGEDHPCIRSRQREADINQVKERKIKHIREETRYKYGNASEVTKKCPTSKIKMRG